MICLIDINEILDRNDVLVYTTEIISAPLTVIGDVFFELHVQSTTRDTDFIVELMDVMPDGRSIKFDSRESSQLRLRYREGLDREVLMIAGHRVRDQDPDGHDGSHVLARASHPNGDHEQSVSVVQSESEHGQPGGDRHELWHRGQSDPPSLGRSTIAHSSDGCIESGVRSMNFLSLIRENEINQTVCEWSLVFEQV